MRLQHGAVALQIDGLTAVGRKHPVPAGLFQAAPHGIGLVTGAGRA
jgi:hypothetical protein